MFQRSEPMQAGVWDNMMRGLNDPQLRNGGEGFPGRLRSREVCGEREMESGQHGPL